MKLMLMGSSQDATAPHYEEVGDCERMVLLASLCCLSLSCDIADTGIKVSGLI